MDIPYARCDAIAKMIPNDLGMTLEKALKASPDLKKAYDEDPQVKYLIDMSRAFGRAAKAYLHACGRCCHQPYFCR